MSSILLPFIVSLVAGCVNLGISVYAWWQDNRAARLLALMAFFEAVYTFAYACELIAPSLNAKIFWDDLQWYPSYFTPIFFLLFVLAYTDAPRRAFRMAVGILAVIGAVLSLLVLTVEWHPLIRTNARLIEVGDIVALTYDYQPVVYLIFVVIYSTTLISFVLLGRQMLHSSGIYRRRIVIVMLGMTVLMGGGMISLSGVTILGQRDLSPITFPISTLLFAWSVFGYRLINLIPVARTLVFENMSDAVLVVNEQRQIIDLNPAAQKLFAPTQLNGQDLSAALGQWESAVPYLETRAVESAQLRVSIESQPHYLALTIVPLKDRSGAVHGRIFTLRNVTAQVMAEEQNRSRSEELEKLNVALDMALVTTDEARERAERADQIKSQFLASMSHELRTPLNAILNFTEFVALGMMGEVNDRQRDALEKSLESARHLLNLINDVLDITKIEAGMMQLFVEDNVDVRAEANQAVGAVQALLTEKPVELIIDLANDLPLIVGDRRRVRQIFLNLLSNAAKFTEEGSITLRAKTDGDAISFSVTDTGPGIAPEEQEIIFEPFRQTDQGVRHMNGTGLGLPITKRLIESHGGSLWLESDIGKGAAFHVKLPIRSPELLEQLNATTSAV